MHCYSQQLTEKIKMITLNKKKSNAHAAALRCDIYLCNFERELSRVRATRQRNFNHIERVS